MLLMFKALLWLLWPAGKSKLWFQHSAAAPEHWYQRQTREGSCQVTAEQMLCCGLWDGPQQAGLPWEWQVLVSAWKPNASPKFLSILECYKKMCSNTADQSAQVTRSLLVARLLVWHGSVNDTSPLPSSGVSALAESVGLTMAVALSTHGTHTLALTTLSIPVLSHRDPHTAVPSCLLREEQTLTCVAELG